MIALEFGFLFFLFFRPGGLNNLLFIGSLGRRGRSLKPEQPAAGRGNDQKRAKATQSPESQEWFSALSYVRNKIFSLLLAQSLSVYLRFHIVNLRTCLSVSSEWHK